MRARLGASHGPSLSWSKGKGVPGAVSGRNAGHSGDLFEKKL